MHTLLRIAKHRIMFYIVQVLFAGSLAVSFHAAMAQNTVQKPASLEPTISAPQPVKPESLPSWFALAGIAISTIGSVAVAAMQINAKSAAMQAKLETSFAVQVEKTQTELLKLQIELHDRIETRIKDQLHDGSEALKIEMAAFREQVKNLVPTTTCQENMARMAKYVESLQIEPPPPPPVTH